MFVNPTTCASSASRDGDLVDVVSVWSDGERRVRRALPRGRRTRPHSCAAAYFPEANVLVPLDSTAEISNTPTSKSMVVRLEQARVHVMADRSPAGPTS